MKTLLGTLGVSVLAGVSTQALAQTAAQQRPVQWHIDGGYSITSARTSEFLDDGWTIGVGLTWYPTPDVPVGVRADLKYGRYNATDRLIQLGSAATRTRIDDGSADVVGLGVNGVYYLPLGPQARPYITAGIGVAYRRIELTQTVAVGGFVCDPWWGFCAPGFVPGDIVVARDSTTRFSWNGGVGVDFPLSNGGSWFIEASYDRIETSRPTEFIPIRVGLRF